MAALECLETRVLPASFSPGNILVSNSPFTGGDPMLYEYTVGGARQQEFEIPPVSSFELARDLVVDSNGNVQIYNGTFSPQLATFDTAAGTINQTRTFANWSTANNLTYGGIAAYANYVFVTDMVTGNDAQTDRGLVRFNINDSTAVRFASAEGGMIDVAVGLDGLVYGLGPGGSPYGTSIHVYDPQTLALQRTIQMPTQNRAIAVNADGHIFSVGGVEGIRHYDADGSQIGDTLSDGGIGGLADIDVDPDGNLVIASHGGVVAVTTEALQSLTSFNTRTSNGMNFVTWVPKPSKLTLNSTVTTMNENGGTITATVSRTAASGEAVVVSLTSSDSSGVTVPTTVTIPAGQTTSPPFEITAVDNAIASGTQVFTVTAAATSLVSGVLEVQVSDDEVAALELSIVADSLNENGDTTQATISRNSVTAAPLTVTLTSSDSGELNVPGFVTIPAGQASVSFTITGVSDEFVDGDQTVTVNASASGHNSATDTVNVVDNDTATLTLMVNAISITEGEAAVTATIRRNADTTEALAVTLTSSHVTDLNFPTSIQIPAGQTTSDTFFISAVDDTLASGVRLASFAAMAPGFANGVDTLNIIDNDLATITLAVSPDSIAENSGTATATVTRNTPTDSDLTVTLASSNTSKTTVPATVTIPAGQATSPVFDIVAIDNDIADGLQSVVVTATAANHTDGTAGLDIIDDDVAGLSLQIDSSSMSENDGSITATVSRNTPIDGPLTVFLVSSDTSEVNVPATITILAGQSTSASFVISAVDDAVADGLQTVVVTASATGHADASASVDITDDETAALTLLLSSLSMSEHQSFVTATVSRNTPTELPLTVSLHGSDSSEAEVPQSVTIAAGQSTSAAVVIISVDDTLLDGSQSVLITASAENHESSSRTLEVTDDDKAAGNVDEDADFDANDSFLIQLVKLAGSDQQLDQSKGASGLSAEQIRTRISQLHSLGDVDGDGDFDANDAFLIHLVKLAGSDQQIHLSKGTSPLTAAQIRTNIENLASTSSSAASTAATKAAVTASVLQDKPASTLPSTTEDDTVRFFSSQVSSEATELLFQIEGTTFRNWLDAL